MRVWFSLIYFKSDKAQDSFFTIRDFLNILSKSDNSELDKLR